MVVVKDTDEQNHHLDSHSQFCGHVNCHYVVRDKHTYLKPLNMGMAALAWLGLVTFCHFGAICPTSSDIHHMSN